MKVHFPPLTLNILFSAITLTGCGPSKMVPMNITLYVDQPIGHKAEEKLPQKLKDLLEPTACVETNEGYRVFLTVVRLDVPEGKGNLDTLEVPRTSEDEIRLNNGIFNAYTYRNLEAGYNSPDLLDAMTCGPILAYKSKVESEVAPFEPDTNEVRVFISKAASLSTLEVDSIQSILADEYCATKGMRPLAIKLFTRPAPKPAVDTLAMVKPDSAWVAGDTVSGVGHAISGVYVKSLGIDHSMGHPVDLIIFDPLVGQHYIITNTYSESGRAESNAALGLKQLIAKGFVNARILRNGNQYMTIILSSPSLEIIKSEADSYKDKFPAIAIMKCVSGKLVEVE